MGDDPKIVKQSVWLLKSWPHGDIDNKITQGYYISKALFTIQCSKYALSGKLASPS